MKIKILILFLSVNLYGYSQKTTSLGEKSVLKIGYTLPYTLVKVGGFAGYFLIDFGTTHSSINPDNFIDGTPAPVLNTEDQYDEFDFFGSWGKVTLNRQTYSNVKLGDFKQAGILGTDFLSLNIFTIDYEQGAVYRAGKNDFYDDAYLRSLGYKATSAAGYFSNDQNKLNACVANIPTVPVKIGNIVAIAQIDPGFDDHLYRNSLNINQAFYNALSDAGIDLIENPAANTVLTTCKIGVNEPVFAYKLPEGVSFSIVGVDGNSFLVNPDIHLFLKQTPIEAKDCGGIGTWQVPAAQIGASFLQDAKKVIFDPFHSKVWFYTN